MADEGLLFTQFYTSSPVCSPSRYQWQASVSWTLYVLPGYIWCHCSTIVSMYVHVDRRQCLYNGWSHQECSSTHVRACQQLTWGGRYWMLTLISITQLKLLSIFSSQVIFAFLPQLRYTYIFHSAHFFPASDTTCISLIMHMCTHAGQPFSLGGTRSGLASTLESLTQTTWEVSTYHTWNI